MSIEALKLNIEEEKRLVQKLAFFSLQAYNVSTPREQQILIDALGATIRQIRILNDTYPTLLKNISFAKRLPRIGREEEKVKEKTGLVSISYETGDKTKKFIAVKKSDKENYIKELNIFEASLKQLKKRELLPEQPKAEFKKPSSYIKFSNKFFSGRASKLAEKESLKSLGLDLRKASMNMTLKSYIAMALFSVMLSFIIAIILIIFFMFFKISLNAPYFSKVTENLWLRFGKFIGLIIALPALTALSFYFYPSTEKDALRKKIDYELPFVTIQMSAIASSGVEPSNIFKIIAMGREYPAIKTESKRIMNEINLYGYDLVNALRSVSHVSPSKKFAEVLNGFSTTITTGGSLTEFLNKRAETLLFEYRLEMEKYTKAAETFMDIYISVMVAAPMMLMLILIILSLSDLGIGIGIGMLTVIIISIIALVNVVMLAFLHLNQSRF